MKFNNAFSLSHAKYQKYKLEPKEPPKEEISNSKEVSEEIKLEEAFLFLPYCHQPSRGVEGCVQFRVVATGITEINKTIKVTKAVENAVTISDGFYLAKNEVLCTVSINRTDLLKLIDGTLNSMKAFMDQRIKVDNLQGMLQFLKAFSFNPERYFAFIKALRDNKDPVEAVAMPVEKGKAKVTTDMLKTISKVLVAIDKLSPAIQEVGRNVKDELKEVKGQILEATHKIKPSLFHKEGPNNNSSEMISLWTPKLSDYGDEEDPY